MADDIPLSIKIDGLDQAIAQLQQLGEAGSEAFASIGSAVDNINGSMEGFGQRTGKASEHAESAKGKLVELGKGGKEAMDGLSESTERFVGSLAAISTQGAVSAFKGLTDALGSAAGAIPLVGKALEFAVGAFAGAVVATAGMGLALKELTSSAAESIVGLDNLRKAAGTDFETIVGLRNAFAEAGVGAEQFGNIMRFLATRVQNNWAEISRSVRDNADTLEADQIKVREASIALSGAQDQQRAAYIRVSEAALQLADAQSKVQSSTIAVKEAAINQEEAHQKVIDGRLALRQDELSVDQADYNLQLAYGAVRDRDYEQYLKQQSAEIALANAKNRVVEQRRANEQAQLQEQKAAIDYDNALRQQQESVLGLQKAQIALADAQRAAANSEMTGQKLQIELDQARNKLADDRLKSIPAIADTLKKAQTGEVDAQKQINSGLVETTTLFDAIVYNASQREGGRSLTNVIYELADSFKAMGDSSQAAAEKTALIRQLGFRGDAQQAIELLSKGAQNFRDAIADPKNQDLAKRLQELARPATEAEEAFNDINSALRETKDLIGSTFFEQFADGLRGFNDNLRNNRGELVDWAKGLTGIHDILRDVFESLKQGTPVGWIKDAVGAFSQLQHGFEVLIGTAEKFRTVLEKVTNSSWFKYFFPSPQSEQEAVTNKISSKIVGAQIPAEGGGLPQAAPSPAEVETEVARRAQAGLPTGISTVISDLINNAVRERVEGTPTTAAPLPPPPAPPPPPPTATEEVIQPQLGMAGGGAIILSPDLPRFAEGGSVGDDADIERRAIEAANRLPGSQLQAMLTKLSGAIDSLKSSLSQVFDVVKRDHGPLIGPARGADDTASALRENTQATRENTQAQREASQARRGGAGGETAPQVVRPGQPAQAASAGGPAVRTPGVAVPITGTGPAIRRPGEFATGAEALTRRPAGAEGPTQYFPLGPQGPEVAVPPGYGYPSTGEDQDVLYAMGQPFAAGGRISGPGSGTSDSILARVSHGEYIVRSSAVQHYGVGIMNALNSMALPRFASGGGIGPEITSRASEITSAIASMQSALANQANVVGSALASVKSSIARFTSDVGKQLSSQAKNIASAPGRVGGELSSEAQDAGSAPDQYGAGLSSFTSSVATGMDYGLTTPGYASGGFVRLFDSVLPGLPKFATGGPVSHEQQRLTLVLEGRSYDLSGAPSTIGALSRHATNSKLGSTMKRKPNWMA